MEDTPATGSFAFESMLLFFFLVGDKRKFDDRGVVDN